MTQSGGNYDEEDWESFAFPTYNGLTDMTGYDMSWGYVLWDYPGYNLYFPGRCGGNEFEDFCNGHYNYYSDGLWSAVKIRHNDGEGFYDQVEYSFFGACVEENNICLSFVVFQSTVNDLYNQLFSVWLNDDTEMSASHPDVFGSWTGPYGLIYDYEGAYDAGVYQRYYFGSNYTGLAGWPVWTPEYYADSGITEIGDTINVWSWADRNESQDNVSDTVTKSHWVFAEVEEPGCTNQAIVSGAGLALGIFLGATALL